VPVGESARKGTRLEYFSMYASRVARKGGHSVSQSVTPGRAEKETHKAQRSWTRPRTWHPQSTLSNHGEQQMRTRRTAGSHTPRAW
jgi:hypothetical protein